MHITSEAVVRREIILFKLSEVISKNEKAYSDKANYLSGITPRTEHYNEHMLQLTNINGQQLGLMQAKLIVEQWS